MDQVKAARQTLNEASKLWLDDPPIKVHAFSLEHLEFMMKQIEGSMSESKRGRWLGWMQAVVVAQTVLSLEDMKRINQGYAE